MQAGPSVAAEHFRAVLSSIRGLIGQLELSDPESGLDVLEMADMGLRSRSELAGVRATLKIKASEVRAEVEVVCQLGERLSEAASGVEELRTVQAEPGATRDRNLAFLAECDAPALKAGQVPADRDTATFGVQASQAEEPDRDQQLGDVIKAVWRLEAKVTDTKSRAVAAETPT